jgi:hypothetical protein
MLPLNRYQAAAMVSAVTAFVAALTVRAIDVSIASLIIVVVLTGVTAFVIALRVQASIQGDVSSMWPPREAQQRIATIGVAIAITAWLVIAILSRNIAFTIAAGFGLLIGVLGVWLSSRSEQS